MKHRGATDTAFLRELFLERLPANVRMEVAAPSVAAASEVEQLQLRAEVAQLQTSIKVLTQETRTCNRRSPSPAARTPSTSLCWYHYKFGEAAWQYKHPVPKPLSQTRCHWPTFL